MDRKGKKVKEVAVGFFKGLWNIVGTILHSAGELIVALLSILGDGDSDSDWD